MGNKKLKSVQDIFRKLKANTYVWCALLGSKISYNNDIFVKIKSTHTTYFSENKLVHYCTPYIGGIAYDNVELEIWEDELVDKTIYNLNDVYSIHYIDFPYVGTLNTKDNGNKEQKSQV